MRHAIIVAAILTTTAPAALAVPVLQSFSRSAAFSLPFPHQNATVAHLAQSEQILTKVTVQVRSGGLWGSTFGPNDRVQDGSTLSGPGFSFAFDAIAHADAHSPHEWFYPGEVRSVAITNATGLGQYYGTGTIGVLNNPHLSFDNCTSSGHCAVFPLKGRLLTITSSYYNHAAPALSAAGDATLFLDFGEVKRNSGLLTQNFSLFNNGQVGSDTLDLLRATTFNKSLSNIFSTTLAPFTGQIDGSASQAYNISFNTKTSGYFSQIYTLNFADTNVGGIGERSYSPEHIVVTGIVDPGPSVVVPAPSDVVPAPGATALFGFGSLGLIARRRRA